MDEDAGPFAGAVGKWVWLRDLREIVMRELPFMTWCELASPLKEALETNEIYGEVLTWDGEPYVPLPARGDWASHDRNGEPHRVTVAGWGHVDLADGTLAGHQVRILWEHVRRAVSYTPGYGKRVREARAARTQLAPLATEGKPLSLPESEELDQPQPQNDLRKTRTSDVIRKAVRQVYNDAEKLGAKQPNVNELPPAVLEVLAVSGLSATWEDIRKIGGEDEFKALRLPPGEHAG